jgi:hypothetical protein
MSECSLLGWLTLTVLFLTGAVITWYTVETYRLRRESQLQTELQTRPFLSVASPGRDAGLVIKNLGHGLARSISVDTIRISDGLEIRSPLVTHVGPGEQAVPLWRVASRVFVDGEMSDEPGEDHSESAARTLTHPTFGYALVLTYSSIIGQQYRTSLVVRRGGSEIEITNDRRV